MSLLLAAVGATMAALLELTVSPYVRVGDAHPHLVLALAVVVTVAVGIEEGLTWAFVGGVVLDVLAQRPLGSSAFALLVSVGITAVIGRFLVRLRPIAPILIVLPVSLFYSMTLFVLFGALRGPIPTSDPIGVLLPGAIYDTVVAIVVGPLAVALRERYVDPERATW